MKYYKKDRSTFSDLFCPVMSPFRHNINATNQVIFVSDYQRPLFAENLSYEKRSFDHFLLYDPFFLLGKCTIRNIRRTENGIHSLFQLHPSGGQH